MLMVSLTENNLSFIILKARAAFDGEGKKDRAMWRLVAGGGTAPLVT